MPKLFTTALLLLTQLCVLSAEEAAAAEPSLTESINNWFGTNLVGPIAGIMFANVGFGIPFIVALLGVGAVFFTLWFKFINIRLFKHGVDCVRGKYDNPADAGEVTHFKALTSALSATVGLGNIAGVAIAIAVGGPGAVFWMWLVAFCGMTLKFASCTLGQAYRRIDENGVVLGGPMAYLRDGIAEVYPKQRHFGEFLAGLYAIFIILASIGGGNMFQSNTSYAILVTIVPGAESVATQWIVGIIFAVATGAVIIGGIRRIGNLTATLVPAMCIFYVVSCLIIILANITQVPSLFGDIFMQAFVPEAAFGGFVGVLVQGMKRAAFSNEAGLGSAAIAHAAAKTDEPVREGVVAMLGPFIDTLIVCTMTALTILITGVLNTDAPPGNSIEGAALTASAMNSVSTILSYGLIVVVFTFAYSTLISWSYYGDRAVEYLFGKKGIMPYRIIYVLLAVLGPVLSVGHIITFSELMILALAFPNIIGLFLLTKKLTALTKDYTSRLASGSIKEYTKPDSSE